jgi:hypothetical protein
MYEDQVPESVWAPPSRPGRPWRHRSARRLWKSPKDGQDRPLGVWLTDESAALVRFDRVEAYEPTGALAVPRSYVDDLGPWLAEEYPRVHGIKKPRP